MYIGEHAHSPPRQAENITWLVGMYIGPQSTVPDGRKKSVEDTPQLFKSKSLGYSACSQILSQTLTAVCISQVRLLMQEGPVGVTSLSPAFLTLACPLRMLLSFRLSHDGGAECLMG